MRKALSNILLYGGILFAVQVCLNEVVLPSDWQSQKIYIYTPMIFALSLLVVFATFKIHQSAPDRSGVSFAYLSMVKLLIVAVALLIQSKNLGDENRIALGIHILSPAMLFIALETKQVLALFKR